MEEQLTQDESSVQSTDAPQTSNTEQGANSGLSNEQVQQLVELDKLEKFKFQGKEWSPKDFTKGVMLHSDYTRKTTELAEERKYYDNLQADLDSVRKNPELANNFKSVYPEKYHTYLRFVQAETMKANSTSEPDKNFNIPEDLKNDIETVKRFYQEQQVKAATAELDSILEPLNKKYPYAFEEAALTRADNLMKRGIELTPQVWENIYKDINQSVEKRAKENLSAQVGKQRSANVRGSDVPAGGGTPSAGPRIPKSIREARAMHMEEINQSSS